MRDKYVIAFNDYVTLSEGGRDGRQVKHHLTPKTQKIQNAEAQLDRCYMLLPPQESHHQTTLSHRSEPTSVSFLPFRVGRKDGEDLLFLP